MPSRSAGRGASSDSREPRDLERAGVSSSWYEIVPRPSSKSSRSRRHPRSQKAVRRYFRLDEYVRERLPGSILHSVFPQAGLQPMLRSSSAVVLDWTKGKARVCATWLHGEVCAPGCTQPRVDTTDKPNATRCRSCRRYRRMPCSNHGQRATWPPGRGGCN
jgi:hypothetical protein